MDQFNYVFDKTSIYRTLFFSVKAVTEYPTVEEFRKNDVEAYSVWNGLATKRYNLSVADDVTYLNKGCYLPELCKIVSITIGFITDDNGNQKRNLKVFDNPDEEQLLRQFFDVVNYHTTKMNNNNYLCGHNITGYDIPFLIKRALKHNIEIPLKFKKNLTAKPWENSILDTANLWKFEGSDYISLNMIATFLKLKYKETIRSIDNFNNYYYLPEVDGSKCAVYESGNQVNLIIQLYKKLMEM